MSNKAKKKKIGIVGCGAIGEGVALFIDRKLKQKAHLVALADVDKDKAISLKRRLSCNPKIVSINALIDSVDLIIEVASQDAADYILKRAIKRGKDAIILSMGALLKNRTLLKQAGIKDSTIYIPSGAICGVDGLSALSVGCIKEVCLTTSKPPRGLMGAEYLKSKNISLKGLKKEKVVFRGTVKEAIKSFPKNINVAATLLMASNFSNVKVCIKADPRLRRNTHNVAIEAKAARISINIENIPSAKNPKTSALTILSTQALLNKIFSSFKIGS